jgi:hypothetical protein
VGCWIERNSTHNQRRNTTFRTRVGGWVGYEGVGFLEAGKKCSLFHIENPCDDYVEVSDGLTKRNGCPVTCLIQNMYGMNSVCRLL